MPRAPRIASIQLGFPLVEQSQRRIRIADFITQVVRNAAIGIDIEKILPQPLAEETMSQPKNSRNECAPDAGNIPALQLATALAPEWHTRVEAWSHPGKGRKLSVSPGVVAGNGWHGQSVRFSTRLIVTAEHPHLPKSSDAGYPRYSTTSIPPQWPGMMAVLISPLRFSMWRKTCCSRDSGASPVM